MKTRLVFNLLLFGFLLVLVPKQVLPQGFKGVVPLESTCEDVRRLLKVKECKYPQSTYFLSDYWITVNFTSGNPCESNGLCYRVPWGRVASLTVDYNKRIPIAEFEYELQRASGPFGDIGIVSYRNPAKGVSVLTHEGKIGTAIFYPTPEQHKKYAYKCGCKKETDE